jgi:glutathione synthase/RimK-type ligase-like ATP-grasp enzyme
VETPQSPTPPLKIAVGRDDLGWDARFAEALDKKIAAGKPLIYSLVSLERHDWAEVARPFDLILWKPDTMGVAAASHFKEKIYFLEKYLGKEVVPNYATIWHFESKIAQSYLFDLEKVPTPRTVATFDEEELPDLLAAHPMPLVVKHSEGASSQFVRLVRAPREILRIAEWAFSGERYKNERLKQGGPRYKSILALARKRWFWKFLVQYGLGREIPGHVYWQEFMAGNEADLRITVIGDRFAYGFWRNNRPGDFRASGSGRLDFTRKVPEVPLRYCMGLSRRLGVDSMAYDILFRGEEFVINEMSYAYLDSAPYKTSGYYELDGSGALTFVPGHVWPETLWVEWALLRWERTASSKR